MKNRRIHIVVGATIFAVLLWIIVNMRDQYQTTIPAPFIVENIPQGKAIQTPVPRYVYLKCRSDGWRLAALTLGGEVKCVVDMNSLPSKQSVLTLKDILERVNMPLGIQPVSMRPESLFITIDDYAQKVVPIVLDTLISFKDGYGQVGTAMLTPDSVRIGGAETVLRTIPFWRTDHTAFENLKASVDTDVLLADTSSYMVRFWPTQVRVRISVQPFAEKSFSGLPVEVRSAPNNREVILIPPKIDIVVRGGIEQLSSLNLPDFHVSIDYAVVVKDTSGFMEPDIVAPPGVQVVSRRPERLQYVVRKRL